MDGSVVIAARQPKPFVVLSLVTRMVLFPAQALFAQTLGMVADDPTDSVVVFDADSGQILGGVAVTQGIVGDCSITADQKLGFVTDFGGRVWVIDLAATPPALAQPDPISISNPGEDTALSPDDRYLLVCDGFGSAPVSVVDVATRREVGTYYLGSNCSSVEVCADGSVLVVSSNAGLVHRLLLDDAGQLQASGETFDTGTFATRGPNNVLCAPDSASGVVVNRTPAVMKSFGIPGLGGLGTASLTGSGLGLSGAFPGTPGTVYMRTSGGPVDAFDYDSATGTFGAAPRFSIPAGAAMSFLGIDQMAVDPSGSRLWVSEPGALNAYDAATGVLRLSILDERLVGPSGICFARAAAGPSCGNGVLEDGEQCDDGNAGAGAGDGCSATCEIENQPPVCDGAVPSVAELWPPNGANHPLGIGGVSDPDGDPTTVMVTAVWQDEPLDKKKCPDAVGVGNAVVDLRATRDGSGDGRIYRLDFRADDGRGGSCTGAVRVCVPEKGKAGRTSCVDQGPRFDATGCQ